MLLQFCNSALAMLLLLLHCCCCFIACWQVAAALILLLPPLALLLLQCSCCRIFVAAARIPCYAVQIPLQVVTKHSRDNEHTKLDADLKG
jgi:hypothetical protein